MALNPRNLVRQGETYSFILQSIGTKQFKCRKTCRV